MPYIALTGGFGSGKTTVLHLFRRLGALTIDTDSIVHDLLERMDVIKMIADLLGRDVLKRSSRGVSLDRGFIAERIFDDVGMRKKVEGIIHPLVLERIKDIKSKTREDAISKVIIFEIPLLYEVGMERYFDKTIAVYCDRKTVIKRLSRRGCERVDAIKRMRAQMPIEKKIMLADFVIDNSNGIKKTTSQVKEVFRSITSSLHQTLSPF